MTSRTLPDSDQGDGLGPTLTLRQARQLELVHRAVTMGMARAAEQLSLFVGCPLTIEAPRLGLCPIDELVESTLGSAFDLVDWSAAEAVVTGIYVGVDGDVSGHCILILSPADARALATRMIADLAAPDLPAAPGLPATSGNGAGKASTAQDEALILSALGEVGNITVSSLLNALADATHLRIASTCPAVVTDMAGAILEWPVLDLAQSADQALYIETRITIGSFATSGSLALIPRTEGLARLIAALEGQKGGRR